MARRQFRIVPFAALTAVLAMAGCASSADDLGGEDLDTSRNAIVDEEGRSVLPNWATDDEAAIESVAPPPARARASRAPAAGFRVPAEYEPVSQVVMTWAGHSEVLKGISVAASAAGAEVVMVGGPSTIAGVAAGKYKPLALGFNSIWARDYGPVGINEATQTLGIVDTTYRHYAVRRDDDAMSCRLANTFQGDCHTTNLILDGGNFMNDRWGNVFVTSRIYAWNRSMSRAQVDELLKTYLGATKVHVLDYAQSASGEPLDGTGHLDMFAKLVDDCNVIVAQTTNEPFKTVTDKAANYFANLECGKGGRYQVTRVKGWLQGRTWYTYSNSLMVNNSVIIPFYNDSAKNEEARRAYQAALPNHTIVGVLSESTIVQGGSIHCITKEIPKVAAR